MKVDRFMSRLEITQIGEVSEEALRAICEKAESFVRAGVTLTIEDCLEMNEVTLTAFMRARELVEEERRALLVAAFQAPAAEAQLDAAADEALVGFVRKMERRAS